MIFFVVCVHRILSQHTLHDKLEWVEWKQGATQSLWKQGLDEGIYWEFDRREEEKVQIPKNGHSLKIKKEI